MSSPPTPQQDTNSSLIYRHHIQNTLIASLPKNSLLRSTLSFFHHNLQYFSEHPFEFSRLVAQLESESDRERFRELVWIYWSKDVLMWRQEAEERQRQGLSASSRLQESLSQSNPQALVQKKHAEYLQSQLRSGVALHDESSPHDEVRIQLFGEAFQFLKSNHRDLSSNSHRLFYNVLLQMNWKESILLEKMWNTWVLEREQNSGIAALQDRLSSAASER